ncbi:MAG TPA: hypothetical protein DD670_04600 [Planctomycetaceae bacterium]|nr:hypothetical protein [Planctomycetaceae bacterium]
MKDQDRTKQQLIEELAQLRQHIADQQQINDNLPVLVATAGFDGYYKKVNAAFERMLGWSEEWLLSRHLMEFIHPDDHAAAIEAFERLKAGEAAINFVDRKQCKGGSYRWVSWVVIPVPDREVVFGIGEDITERRLAEEALRQSEERYRQLADSTPDVIYILDETGKLLYANRVAGAYFGASPESLVGKTQQDLFPSEKAKIHLERIQTAFETGEIGDREDLYRFGDREVWLNVRTIPLRDRQGRVTSLMGLCRDITARKQAEEALKKAHGELEEQVKNRTAELRAANDALRESEGNFRTLVETLPDAVVRGDLTGHITYASRQTLRMYGTDNADDILTKNPLDFFAPEDHENFRANLQKTLEEGVTRNVEYNLVRKDGTRFVGEVSAAAMNDMAGKPKGFVAILRDITERKQADEALCRLTERLSLATMAANVGIWDLDIPNNKLVWDESMFRLYGITPNDFGGAYEAWQAGVHPEDWPRVEAETQMALHGAKEFDTEFRVVWPNKSVHWIKANGLVQHDASGTAVRMLGTNRDITIRKQAEEAIRQSHDELQAIYDQAVEGIVIVDNKTANPIRANSAFCQLLGYTDESVPFISTEMLHPPGVLPTVLEYLDAVKEGSVARIDDLPFLRKDGSRVYADVVSSSIRYNECPCWISFFHDVTERHLAREALERERQSLWNMLQASDHERQVIAYDIHDGLAQYLAAAGMQLQVYDSLKENSPNDARKAYETAVQLVRQAHAESRRLISEVRHPVIDERGIETAITSLAYEQRQHGGPRIECHTSVEFDRLPPILENALYRMAQEALTNACKHSRSKKVTVSLIQEGQNVRLEVQDDGIGFDTEAIGTGCFGLESIRQRVRLLGGRLIIESQPGNGTLVRAVVPIVERQKEQ